MHVHPPLLWRIQTVLKSDPICDSVLESTVGQHKQSNVENCPHCHANTCAQRCLFLFTFQCMTLVFWLSYSLYSGVLPLVPLSVFVHGTSCFWYVLSHLISILHAHQISCTCYIPPHSVLFPYLIRHVSTCTFFQLLLSLKKKRLLAVYK